MTQQRDRTDQPDPLALPFTPGMRDNHEDLSS